MRMKKEFLIPFEGLKVGKHPYDFDITETFFEDLEYSLIDRGSIHVSMELEKKEQMMTAAIHMDGFVWSECDLCTESLKVPVHIDHHVVFKFGETESDDEDLIMVNPSDFELDMAPVFYELITVHLPNKTTHEEGECNEDMLDLLDKYSGIEEESEDEEDDDIDPRWDALKNLN